MAQRHLDYRACEYRRQYEALKDAEYQAALAKWNADAAAARARKGLFLVTQNGERRILPQVVLFDAFQ